MRESNQAVVVNESMEFDSPLAAARKLNSSARAVIASAKTGELLRGTYAIRFKGDVVNIEVEFVETRAIHWHVKGSKKPKWPKGHPEFPKTCEQCGNAFVAKRYEARFCSHSCSATHNERKKGNRPKLAHTCAVCSKEFFRYDPPSAIGIVPKYCSRTCQNIQQNMRLSETRTTSENIDFRKVRAKLKQKQYSQRYNQTEAGKASKRASALRAYQKRKAKK